MYRNREKQTHTHTHTDTHPISMYRKRETDRQTHSPKYHTHTTQELSFLVSITRIEVITIIYHGKDTDYYNDNNNRIRVIKEQVGVRGHIGQGGTTTMYVL